MEANVKCKAYKFKTKKKIIKVVHTNIFSIAQEKEKDEAIPDFYSNPDHIIMCAEFCFYAERPVFGEACI